MKSVIISDPGEFEEKKKKVLREGIDKFHVITDFDRTLTKAFVNRRRVPSIISILRDYDYLDEDYSTKAKELFNKYHPIEIDSNISEKEKKRGMNQWWTEHFELLLSKGLNKKHLERIVNKGHIQFRGGVSEFLISLYQKKIPLIILSSSGLGESIPFLLIQNNCLYSNIYLITNFFDWDSNGNAISIRKPIIHSMNKDETIIKGFPVYSKIKDRKNVLLLGDSLEDLGMIKGFDYDNLISIGFLNENVEANLKDYKKNFDAIITNDGNFDFVNDFMKGFS